MGNPLRARMNKNVNINKPKTDPKKSPIWIMDVFS